MQKVVELGQKSIAITDHGTTSGLWAFQKECESKGIKPILGCEFYMEHPYKERGSSHLIVLAKNNKGLENIFKLQEYAYTTGFNYKPRITTAMLKRHSEGLVVSTACIGSIFAQHVMNDNILEAMSELKTYKSIFGEDFYIEIQSNTIDEQKRVNESLVSLARELGIEVILTNDCHYINEEDWYAHDVLLALQTRKKMDDPKRWSFPAQDFWVKSEEEMRENLSYFTDEQIDKFISNTQVIADKCNARIEPGNFLPSFHTIPKGETARSVLVNMAKLGIEEKSYHAHVKDIQNEIDVIDGEGLCDYFLIVQDYINASRKNEVLVGDGRGSGAGSKLGYALDIHRVDPHKYNLLFERFMAPGRHPDLNKVA